MNRLRMRSLTVAALTAAMTAVGAPLAQPALAWSWDPVVTYQGTMACRPPKASDLVVTGSRHGAVTVSGATRQYHVTFTDVPSGGAQVTFTLHCGGGEVFSVVHHVTRPSFGRSVRYDLVRGAR